MEDNEIVHEELLEETPEEERVDLLPEVVEEQSDLLPEAVEDQSDVQVAYEGPDDAGGMIAKYGGPAMLHPGGDRTIRLYDEGGALVSWSNGKNECFVHKQILPVDLWEMTDQNKFVATTRLTWHRGDGYQMAISPGMELPASMISVEKSVFAEEQAEVDGEETKGGDDVSETNLP